MKTISDLSDTDGSIEELYRLGRIGIDNSGRVSYSQASNAVPNDTLSKLDDLRNLDVIVGANPNVECDVEYILQPNMTVEKLRAKLDREIQWEIEWYE